MKNTLPLMLGSVYLIFFQLSFITTDQLNLQIFNSEYTLTFFMVFINVNTKTILIFRCLKVNNFQMPQIQTLYRLVN